MIDQTATQRAKDNAGSISPDASKKKILDEVMALRSQMKGDRAGWDSHWQCLQNYVQPRKAYVTQTRTENSPIGEKETQLFDSTAVQSNLILAAGHMTWMTPQEQRWFSFQPPPEFGEDDEVRKWFQECTRIVAMELANSNFYSETHESYLDRGAVGTTAMWVGAGKRTALNFRHEDIGTYSVAEDDEGYADSLVRDFKRTIKQAYQMFGEALHPKVLEDYRKDAKCREREIDLCHAVYPRLERDPGNPSKLHKAFASVYVDVTNQHIIEVGGFDDLPYAVSRFLKWGRSPYGWSPAWVALPEMRQLNFLAKNMDLLTELLLFPRLLIPSALKGSIDLRPGGLTYMKDGAAKDEQPREWATVGEFKQGMESAAHKRKKIEEAFHVDLFQMFKMMERNAQMTAREVAERASEKLIQFSPTFYRLTTEFYNPILKRVFRICYNAGKFPPPPMAIMKQISDTQWAIAEPQIGYHSRVAQSVQQLDNTAFLQTLDGLGPTFQVDPSLVDNFNWSNIVRDMGRNNGLPEAWIAPPEQVAALKQQRAQQLAQSEQAQIAHHMAGAAQKLGSIPPNSPVADMITKNANA